MPDDGVAIQPSDPSSSMITGDPIAPQPTAPATGMVQPQSTPAYGSLAAQVLAQQQAQNPAPPANATAPLDMSSAAPYLGTPTPPDVREHLNWIQKTLSSVGSALAGPKTWTVTKQPDGSVTTAEVPATTGDKWGKIAAAALTGAAAGLANSQGPEGLAKAGAAGVQAGLQIPTQQKAAAQQEAAFQNKQLLSQANRIHLTQQTYMLAQEAKMNDLKFNEASEAVANKYADALLNSPGAVDLGKVDPSDPNAAMNLAKTNPGAMQAFLGKGDKMMRFVTGPDHQMHMVMTDKAWEQQRNSEPMEAFYVGKGENGEPTLMSQTVPVNGDTRENINTHNAAVMKGFYGNLKDYASAKKDLTPKTPKEPTNWQEAYSAASAAKDPAEQTRYKALGDELYSKQVGLKETKAGGAGEGGGYQRSSDASDFTKGGQTIWGKQWGGGDPNSAFENTSRQLALGEKTESDLPKRNPSKGQPGIQDYSNRARQISQDYFGSQYEYNPVQIQKEQKDYNNLKVSSAYNAMDRLIGPMGKPVDPNSPPLLDQLEQAAKDAGLSGDAPINSVMQWVRRWKGDDAANALAFDLAETRKSLGQVTGNPILGNSDTNLKLQQMTEQYGNHMTVSNLAKVNSEARKAIQAEREAGFTNNRFLRRAYGGESITAMPSGPTGGAPQGGQGTPTPQPTTTQPQATGGGQPKQSRRLADAMALPMNKGKTSDQVRQDLINHGYNPV